MPIPANRARFLLSVAGIQAKLSVLGFHGREAISELFQFQIEIVSTEDLDLDCLPNRDAVLEIVGEQKRYLHGSIAKACHLATRFRFRHYRLTLVPRLYWLGLRHNFRIFQDQSVPDIARTILADAGIEPDFYRFELVRTYRTRPFTVQYDESDLHFLKRLLADEGIHFHFDHQADRHLLVLADHGQSFRFLTPRQMDYRADAAMVSDTCIQRFSMHKTIAVEGLTLDDYDFQKPQHKLLAQVQYQPFNRLTMYRWPGNYPDPETGSQVCQRELDALRMGAQQATGESGWEALGPGRVFRLARHPNTELNQDYLVLSVEHQGEQPQVLEEHSGSGGCRYTNRFTAMPATQPYQPLRHWQKPLAAPQTAVVVGPPGEQIYTDEYGRIQVRFHWDREGRHSCWLRLAQGWAGNFWGSMVLPRIGQEVLVEFIDGDPERPIVTGCLYHGLHKPPYPLPEHKTRTLLRSQSLSGADGHEFMLEDAPEQEKISIHSSRDLEVHASQDMLTTIERHRQTHIAGDEMTRVAGNNHTRVSSESRTHVAGQDSLTLGKSLHVKAGQGIHQQAGQELHYKAGMKLVIEAGTAIHLKAGAGSILIDPTGVHLNGPTIGLNGGGSAGVAVAASPPQPMQAEALAFDASGRQTQPGAESLPPAASELHFTKLGALPDPLAFLRGEILALASDEKVLGHICQRQADGTCLRGDCACNPAKG